MTRTLRAVLLVGAILMILVWASGCYLSFYIHDDCVDALNKSSGERALYETLLRECAGSDDRLQWLSTWGFAVCAAVSAVLLWLRVRLSKAPGP